MILLFYYSSVCARQSDSHHISQMFVEWKIEAVLSTAWIKFIICFYSRVFSWNIIFALISLVADAGVFHCTFNAFYFD